MIIKFKICFVFDLNYNYLNVVNLLGIRVVCGLPCFSVYICNNRIITEIHSDEWLGRRHWIQKDTCIRQ